MTRTQSLGGRLRWLILVIGVLYLAAGIWCLFAPLIVPLLQGGAGLLGTPAVPLMFLVELDLYEQDEVYYYLDVLLYLGVFLVTQWLFLFPRRGWTIQLQQSRRPMLVSIIGAALMAMLLTVGAVATLLEIPNWWEEITPIKNDEFLPHLWQIMAWLWCLWAVIFYCYWRKGNRQTQLSRMTRGLIAGSILELIVATPVHIWAVRERDCYFARGSYTGLVFGGTVLLWTLGPDIVLLFIREYQRRHDLLDTLKRSPSDT